ncbi:RNA polymerase sigma-70 factor [Paenibacillus woosongensis]|uniref:RNA polymerase sigma-70 factor n=1 Tax=Paenibacillus woosongensis TaxID=307580 RepID=A0A7X2YYL9_9BACL|nr:RNA polymerase sigma-70 factor [Paenibacillus woosongensis]MUG44257.1 RNA polymerase sigma-70 factor [Paenibacillus woosongensis]
MHELYEKYRRLLFTLAYQLTGSAADAEDAVQEVFLKVYAMNTDHIEEPKAYLCKMVTNRCLDLLRSSRKRRERYVGPWLPEPVPTPEEDALQTLMRNELLSYAMLVLLERLSAAERAVFVLREALGFDYFEIAGLLDKSEVNCRKLMSRARGKMGADAAGITDSREAAGQRWVQAFLQALEQGNMDVLLAMLTEDVVVLSDGGGKVAAAVRPITSRDHVSRFLLGLMQQLAQQGDVRLELASINGDTGVIVRSSGSIDTIVLLQVEEGAARRIYFIRNPDKLTHI